MVLDVERVESPKITTQPPEKKAASKKRRRQEAPAGPRDPIADIFMFRGGGG